MKQRTGNTEKQKQKRDEYTPSLRMIKILLIEDNPGDVRFIEELLKDVPSIQYELEYAMRLEQGTALLGEKRYSIILLDLALPDSQGLDTFEEIRKSARDTPIVLLTGLNDERVAAAAAYKGAEDFLVKGKIDSNLLGRSIQYAIERHKLKTELRNLSTIDELTGLFNRRGFFTLAKQQLKLAQRTKREMVLLYIDIDNMKVVNDSLGHHVGDKTLAATATVLKNTFRASDIIARIGGDEFVVFAIECTHDSGDILVNRLQKTLETFNASSPLPISLSLSIGTANYSPDNPCTIDELLTKADTVMYGQKRLKEAGTFNELRATFLGEAVSDLEYRQEVYKMLIIEDNPGDSRLICEMLKDIEGLSFELHSTDRLSNGINILADSTIDVVLVDLMLPDSDGLNTHKKVQACAPDIPIIVLTNLNDENLAIQAVRDGAQDYLVKNYVNSAVLMHAVRYAIERKKTERELQNNLSRLQKTFEETVNALGSALAKRDPYTASHQQRVTKLACIIAGEMKLSKKQIKGIHIAGLLHDIGKIAVPTEILTRPIPLTKAEVLIVRTHCKVGYDILKAIEFPWPVAGIVYQHHERLNGSGYPQGLTDKDILIEAKILAVADVVEAMCSHRPYRPAQGIDKALAEIEEKRGTLYDSRVVDACISVFRKRNFRFEQ